MKKNTVAKTATRWHRERDNLDEEDMKRREKLCKYST